MSINFSKIRETNFLQLENRFWGIKLNKDDHDSLTLFQKVITLKNSGLSSTQISKNLGISKSTVGKWIWCDSLPNIVRLANHELNELPEGKSWLSINSTRGGLFTGPWITVPHKIAKFDDITEVLQQLKSLPDTKILEDKFKIEGLDNFKQLAFAYLLGVMLGDASKDKIVRIQRITRRLTLRLTKLHQSNERFGEFVCLCLTTLGLRVNRGKDMRPGKHNKHPFYSWHSQCSPLLAWMFNVCLGLKDTEVTTYNKIRTRWLLSTPRDFKIWFLQGLADSDGYIDLGSFEVGIITHPNTKFLIELFTTLRIKAHSRLFTKNMMTAAMIGVNDAFKLLIFNRYVKSYRYSRMLKLAGAKRICGHWPKWLSDKVDMYVANNLKATDVCRKIMDEHNIAIRTKQIYRRIKIRKYGK